MKGRLANDSYGTRRLIQFMMIPLLSEEDFFNQLLLKYVVKIDYENIFINHKTMDVGFSHGKSLFLVENSNEIQLNHQFSMVIAFIPFHHHH